MNPLTELVVKVSLILSVALGLAIILGTKSAALRHWVLSVGIVCAVAAPVLVSFAPAWQAPIHLKAAEETRQTPIVRPPVGEVDATPVGVTTLSNAEASRPVRLTTLQVFAATWIAGACVGLATIIIVVDPVAVPATERGDVVGAGSRDRSRDGHPASCHTAAERSALAALHLGRAPPDRRSSSRCGGLVRRARAHRAVS